MIIGPPVKSAPPEFRAVVDDQDIRISALMCFGVQN
jgi:hypothetical protein